MLNAEGFKEYLLTELNPYYNIILLKYGVDLEKIEFSLNTDFVEARLKFMRIWIRFAEWGATLFCTCRNNSEAISYCERQGIKIDRREESIIYLVGINSIGANFPEILKRIITCS